MIIRKFNDNYSNIQTHINNINFNNGRTHHSSERSLLK